MVQQVYSALGFSSYKLVLSTRPERDYIGTVEQWDSAEKALSNALDSFGQPWEHNIGDGAFYGPKIDIRVSDALGRMHQTATIQLDFQLPKRFNLQYQSKSGELERPVIIHRAVLGSIERMFAILIEHYAGKWPIWLSPRQVMIIPVADACFAYGEKVLSDIKRQAEGRFHVDIDTSSNTFNKKIRDAQAQQYNFIVVVGDMEEAARTISVRSRAGAQLEPMNSQLFVDKLKKLITDQALDD